MTMLIAGHETTAAVLTWAVFLLSQVWFSLIGAVFLLSQIRAEEWINQFICSLVSPRFPEVCSHANKITFMQSPSKMKKAQAEIDSVLGQGRPTFDSLKKLEWVRESSCMNFFLSMVDGLLSRSHSFISHFYQLQHWSMFMLIVAYEKKMSSLVMFLLLRWVASKLTGSFT